MAFAQAFLENPRTGQLRKAPVGFSWTMLFFGFFPPMIRGDWKWVGIVLGGGLLLAVISAGILGWVPSLVGAFIWNKHYLRSLVNDGYQLKRVDGSDPERVDVAAGFSVPRLSDASIRP